MSKKDVATPTISSAQANLDAAETTEQTTAQQAERDQLIRERAYLKWQSRSGDNPVSDEETNQIWLEAEQEIDTESK